MFSKMTTAHSHGIPRLFFYLGILTIGQTVIRPALSFTVSDWLFFISLLLTISECLLKRNLEIRFPPIMIIGLYLFTIGGIISSAFTNKPILSSIALIKYLYLIAVWFWLCTILLETPEQIRTSIFLWISSAALSGLGALLQLFWDGIIPGTMPAWGRMTGFTEHVNDLGGLTSIALIPAIMLLTRFEKISLSLLFSWINAILIFGGLVLSVSISGVSALLISLLVWLSLSQFTIKKFVILCISVASFLTVIAIHDSYEKVSIISRLYDISEDGFSLSTLQTRMDTYSAAWEAIKDNPFIGVGLGPNVGVTKTGYVVHNIFLLNWFESGLFGLLGMLLVIFTIATMAYKGIKDPYHRQKRALGIALFLPSSRS